MDQRWIDAGIVLGGLIFLELIMRWDSRRLL